MIKLFKLLFFLPIVVFTHHFSHAQNCNSLLVKNYDEVTGTTIIKLKDYLYIYKSDVLEIAIFAAKKIDDDGIETVLTFSCRELGCIDNGNAINFLFTDGTRAQYTNMSEYNCEGFALLHIDIPDYYGNTISSVLQGKKIKTLRISGDYSPVEVNFTSTNQTDLINILKCLD